MEPYVLFSLFVSLITISLFAWAFSIGSVSWRNGCSINRLGSVPISVLKDLPVLGSMLSLYQGLAHCSLASIASSRGRLSKQPMAFSWCMMMVVMVAVVPSLAVVEDQEIGKILGYTNVTFELINGATGYSSFLARSRNAVEAPTRACGVQSTRRTPLRGAEYIYINLKISNTQWVTLGLDVKTFYVWAYQDNVRYNGNYRASFANDAPKDAMDKLFRGSTIRITRFGAGYGSLQEAAGVTRLNIVLGIRNLDGAIRYVYGRQEGQLNHGNEEAKFFLMAAQMVSEAVRFKFMEEAIVENNNTPNIKLKMVAFQNDWDRISKAIHEAEAKTLKCTTISPTLVISKIGYRQEVNTVAEIKNDLGLIKYYAKAI